MTNHEPSHHDPAEPRPPSAPTPEAINAIDSLYTEYGSAAGAYLSRAGIDPYSKTLARDFDSAHVQSFISPLAMVEDYLDGRFQSAELDRVLEESVQPLYLGEWNHRLIYDHMHELWDIVAMGGMIHAFRK